MIKRNLWMGLVLLVLASCKKDKIETTALASLQISNAVMGGTTLQFGTNVTTVAGNSAMAYGILTVSRQIKLESPGVVYYDEIHDFVNGGVYSLFLGGTPAAVDAVFVKEEHILPYIDNIFGVRIINLSAGSSAISVNLAGAANGSLLPGIAYKSISDFKQISAKAEEGTKTFEFRNTETGALISSFDVPDYDLPRFRNITLVFTGTAGAELVFRVNNY
jgi:hypothetical protein